MPTPFTEEHQQFRKTVRQFCEKELAPHVEEWERDELFPNWVFKRAGELGIFGAHYPEERRRRRRRLLVQRRQGRGAPALPDGRRRRMGLLVQSRHGDARHQRPRHQGAEATSF